MGKVFAELFFMHIPSLLTLHQRPACR